MPPKKACSGRKKAACKSPGCEWTVSKGCGRPEAVRVEEALVKDAKTKTQQKKLTLRDLHVTPLESSPKNVVGILSKAVAKQLLENLGIVAGLHETTFYLEEGRFKLGRTLSLHVGMPAELYDAVQVLKDGIKPFALLQSRLDVDEVAMELTHTQGTQIDYTFYAREPGAVFVFAEGATQSNARALINRVLKAAEAVKLL